MKAIAAKEKAGTVFRIGGGEEFDIADSVGIFEGQICGECRHLEDGGAYASSVVAESEVGLVDIVCCNGTDGWIGEIEAAFFSSSDVREISDDDRDGGIFIADGIDEIVELIDNIVGEVGGRSVPGEFAVVVLDVVSSEKDDEGIDVVDLGQERDLG